MILIVSALIFVGYGSHRSYPHSRAASSFASDLMWRTTLWHADKFSSTRATCHCREAGTPDGSFKKRIVSLDGLHILVMDEAD